MFDIYKNNIYKYHPQQESNSPDCSAQVICVDYESVPQFDRVLKKVFMVSGSVDFGTFSINQLDFCIVMRPYSLHHLLLLSLGFSFRVDYYEKSSLIGERTEYLKVCVEDGSYIIDKDTVDESKHHLLRSFSALHELQGQVRTLFGFELNVNVKKCNHILCLLYELDKYVACIESEISKNGMCMYYTISELCRESPYMVMPMEDVELVASYMVDIEGYLRGYDLEGEQYLYKV